MRDFKEALDRSLDRLDDLLASLRGEGRPAYAGPVPEQGRNERKLDQVTRDSPVPDHTERRPSDPLDAALNALRAAPDPEASAERARQALAEEEQRRADLAQAREVEAAQELEQQAQIEREAEALRLKQEQERSIERDDGMDYGL